MNDYAATNLPFLAEDCLNAFGAERGREIFAKAAEIYDELTRSADCRDNAAVEHHLKVKLLPALSYYKALLACGLTKDDALAAVRAETQKAAALNRDKNAKLMRLPFAYGIYKMGVKSHMRKNFPAAGWQTEWVRRDGREIGFNMRTCLYKETCDALGCPELCAVFCANDTTAFAGLLPKIEFYRNGTLADGAPCCDFRFVKGRGKENGR